MTNPPHRIRIAVVGTGASGLYLLTNLLKNVGALSHTIAEIVLFERGSRAGMGMPYSPATTDRFNLCNISSEEVPHLRQSLGDWLRERSDDFLDRYGIVREHISDDETYARLAVGEYFESQFHAVVSALRDGGVVVRVRLNTSVVDLRDDRASGTVTVVHASGVEVFDRVVIATGHAFNEDDQPEHGYLASPWPMQKVLRAADGSPATLGGTIGTLGASLSAFDVVTSLAHRYGTFTREDGQLRFTPREGTPRFRIVMHDAHGWLPHLQYLQSRPFREVYRHVSRERLLALRTANGQLELTDYFDHVCRHVLSGAFERDARADVAARLREDDYTIENLVADLSAEHAAAADPFDQMRREFDEAARLVGRDKPVYWKEALDDLIYTLSYHGELLSAEDHLRLKRVVLPFLNSVIAAMPLQSAAILLALRDAGAIDVVAGRATVKEIAGGKTTVTVKRVDAEDETAHQYDLFVDCTGQSGLDLDSFPFRTLVADGTVRWARAAFARPPADDERADVVRSDDGSRLLCLPGIDIDAAHRVIGADGRANPRIFDIAFPHITGLRPYSYGLQACNHTAGLVVEAWTVATTTGRPLASNAEALTRLHERVPNEA